MPSKRHPVPKEHSSTLSRAEAVLGLEPKMLPCKERLDNISEWKSELRHSGMREVSVPTLMKGSLGRC